jgi:hypothetical protein
VGPDVVSPSIPRLVSLFPDLRLLKLWDMTLPCLEMIVCLKMCERCFSFGGFKPLDKDRPTGTSKTPENTTMYEDLCSINSINVKKSTD